MISRWMLKKESFAESMMVVIIFSIAQRGVGVIRGIVFARFLGPENYGIFTLAFFFIAMIISFVLLGLPSCYGRYAPQYEMKNMLRDFFWKTHSSSVVAGVVFVIPCLLFSEHISILIYKALDYKNIVLISSFTVIPLMMYRHLFSSFAGIGNFKMSSSMEFGQITLFSIIGVVLVIIIPKAESALIAYLISLIIITIIFGLLFWKYAVSYKYQNVKIHENNFFGKIFKYSIWFVLTPVVFELLRYTDRLMLSHFMGFKEVGIYSVATNVTQLIFMFAMLTANVLKPRLSKLWENNEKDKVMFLLNISTKGLFLLFLGCAVIFILFKEMIISFLYGSEYLDNLPIISMFLVFWLFNIVVWIMGMYPGLIEKTHLQVIAAVPGLLVNICLNYYLIPIYGLAGAAVATVSSYGMILVILLILLKKEKLKIDFGTIMLCLLTIILFLDNAVMVFSYMVLMLFVVLCNVIITKEEKQILARQIKGMI